jgi:hypothetical protein
VQHVGIILEQSCFVGDLPVANNIRYAYVMYTCRSDLDKILTLTAMLFKMESLRVRGVEASLKRIRMNFQVQVLDKYHHEQLQ